MRLFKMMTAAAGLAAMLLLGSAAVSAGRAPRPAPVAPSASAPAAPARAGHALEATDLEAWLDGVVPYALKDGDMAGAVVVVVKDGKVLLQKGYGYADVRARRPMDPEATMVRPGSTSKLFTWTAVMQLVEQGKLDLDRDVNDYLDFKIPQRFGKPITLRDLMNHRAGFEEGLKDILAIDPRGLPSTERYLKDHPRPQLFAPGEVPAYSNYGASLAGYVVERVSHEPFERYVERHILQPLGMNHTSFDQPLQAQFRSAVSLAYRTASGPPHPYELIITRPAGSGTTTASDMARFMIAHLEQGRYGDAQILSPATTALMHTQTTSAPAGFSTMAHGFFHETHNGRTILGHGGDTVVFHTEMHLLPDEHVGIFYNFNSRGREDAVYAAREELFQGFMDRYFPAPPEAAAPPPPASAVKDAQAIAGRYHSSRRVEHGFISFFYLLQQPVITANADGTITAPGSLGRGTAQFRETAPGLWRQVGGDRQLALSTVRGVKTVTDSEDPSSVLQAAPAIRSAPLNLTILIGSFAILVWSLVLWGLSPLLRRGDRAEAGVPAEVRRLRLLTRGAALADVVYLIAWYFMMQPIMNSQIEAYSAGLDPVVRTLQIFGLIAIAAAGVGVWAAWRTFRLSAPWLSRIWSALAAAAMLGVVWLGLLGGLIGFSLNY